MITVMSEVTLEGEMVYPEAVKNWRAVGLEVELFNLWAIEGLRKFIAEPQSMNMLRGKLLIVPQKHIISPIAVLVIL